MVASVEKELLETPKQTADPLRDFALQLGEEYTITVVASNAIGNSSESNPVLFVAPSDTVTTETSMTPESSTTTDHFELLLYILIVSCVVVITIIILVIVVFIIGYRYKSEFFHIVCT